MANLRSLVHLSAQTVGVPTHPQEGVWSSSLPNTTGVIRLYKPVVASNITSRMSLGKCGRPLKPDLKVRPALFMAVNSQQFFNDAQTARSWQMARPSSSSGVIESNEFVRP